jgi:hypothetical protein
MTSAMNLIAQELLKLSNDSLDSNMKPLIEAWSDPPTSLQILEVLDKCIFGALASGFVITTLQFLYKDALTLEGKKHTDNEPLAYWRNI